MALRFITFSCLLDAQFKGSGQLIKDSWCLEKVELSLAGFHCDVLSHWGGMCYFCQATSLISIGSVRSGAARALATQRETDEEQCAMCLIWGYSCLWFQEHLLQDGHGEYANILSCSCMVLLLVKLETNQSQHRAALKVAPKLFNKRVSWGWLVILDHRRSYLRCFCLLSQTCPIETPCNALSFIVKCFICLLCHCFLCICV